MAPSNSLFRVQIKGAIDSIVNLFFSRLFDPDVDICARWKGTQSADSQEKVLPRFFHVATFLLVLFFVQLSEVCENLDLMKKSSENGIKKNSGIILHLGSGAKMPGACIDNVIIN